MFRCSDTTVCNFRYVISFENSFFYFSIDSIFALLVFSFQGASPILTNQGSEGLILQNRTMNIFFTTLRRKTIRTTSLYSCICSANPLCNSLLLCLASDAFQQKSQTVFSPLFSIERRWSSRTFRYGYLVTTSPQSLASPSAAPSLRLGHRLRVLPTPMVWRAVCTRPGNVFTATFWFAITSDSRDRKSVV